MKKVYAEYMLLLLGILSVLTFLFVVAKDGLLKESSFDKSKSVEAGQITPAPYPLKIGEDSAPIISAAAAAVIDADSKKVMFEKNQKLRFSPASTVKIMTALVALEYYTLPAELTVQRESTIPSTMGLSVNEVITFENLLYGLLLNSGNDAALALADNYPGGEEAFVARMNEKAKELSLLDTRFTDPSGLDDDGNFTTAFDLARLGAYAQSNKTFARMVTVKQIVVFDTSGKISHNLQNLNKLLGLHGVNGIKTGTTKGAGEVLVASASREGHTLISVVMKSENRFFDSAQIIEWAFMNFQFVEATSLSTHHQ